MMKLVYLNLPFATALKEEGLDIVNGLPSDGDKWYLCLIDHPAAVLVSTLGQLVNVYCTK